MSLVQEVLRLIFFLGSDEPLTRCKSISNNFTFTTAGGRIVCRQCEGTSRRTKERCKAPALTGRAWCKYHGGKATGALTKEGRERCANAKLVHGRETREVRNERALAMRRLRALEDLGHALGIMQGAMTPGRKPQQ
jgi:hypothetical protein